MTDIEATVRKSVPVTSYYERKDIDEILINIPRGIPAALKIKLETILNSYGYKLVHAGQSMYIFRRPPNEPSE